MNAAFDEGTAALLSAAVAWLVRYRGAWWVVYEHGWLRITDAATAQDLDMAAARLAQAEAANGHVGQDLRGTPAVTTSRERAAKAGLLITATPTAYLANLARLVRNWDVEFFGPASADGFTTVCAIQAFLYACRRDVLWNW